jgi:hypothetical protein
MAKVTAAPHISGGSFAPWGTSLHDRNSMGNNSVPFAMPTVRDEIHVYRQRAMEAEENAARERDEKLKRTWLEIAKGYRFLIEQHRTSH